MTDDISMEDVPMDHLYFESPEAHENCSKLWAAMSHNHNHSGFGDMENACLSLWNERMLDTMGIGGMDGGELPYMSSWWPKLLVQFLYGIVCIIGLAGNTLVIYVVVRFSKMQVSKVLDAS